MDVFLRNQPHRQQYKFAIGAKPAATLVSDPETLEVYVYGEPKTATVKIPHGLVGMKLRPVPSVVMDDTDALCNCVDLTMETVKYGSDEPTEMTVTVTAMPQNEPQLAAVNAPATINLYTGDSDGLVGTVTVQTHAVFDVCKYGSMTFMADSNRL